MIRPIVLKQSNVHSCIRSGRCTSWTQAMWIVMKILRYRAFGVSSLKQKILFLFISQYPKGDFITKHEQFIQPTNFFLIKAILPVICRRFFLGDPHIQLTSIISTLIQFQIFYIFLKGSCQYVVENSFVWDILNV